MRELKMTKLDYYKWYDIYLNQNESLCGFYEYRINNFDLKEYQKYYTYSFKFISKFVNIEYNL